MYRRLSDKLNDKFNENEDNNYQNREFLANPIYDLIERSNADRLQNMRDQSKLHSSLRGIYSLLGTGIGGLGGYGLTSLMTKNKWLRALGALGGGIAGTIIGHEQYEL